MPELPPFGIPEELDARTSRLRLVATIQDVLKNDNTVIRNYASTGFTAVVGGTFPSFYKPPEGYHNRLYIINRVLAGRAVAHLLFRRDSGTVDRGLNYDATIRLVPTEDELNSIQVAQSHWDSATSNHIGSMTISRLYADEASEIARVNAKNHLDHAEER